MDIGGFHRHVSNCADRPVAGPCATRDANRRAHSWPLSAGSTDEQEHLQAPERLEIILDRAACFTNKRLDIRDNDKVTTDPTGPCHSLDVRQT
jgi:hypothetical protein